MGFFSNLFGTPEAEVSQAELAEAELMQGMIQGYKETGIPLERERVAETLGMQWNTETGSYDADPTRRRSHLDANGQVRMNTVNSGAPVAAISKAYESNRGPVNPNMQTGSDDVGDIAQAKDESQAVRQTAEGDVSNAYGAMANAAGLAHGAQMQSANDMSQLANNQSQQANFNACLLYTSPSPRD